MFAKHKKPKGLNENSRHDSLFMERIFFKDVFGEDIGKAIDKAFTDI